MPPEKGDAAYLWDMLDAARAVRDFITGRSFQEYLRDQMLRRAVERSLEIIGEAAGRVSDTLRNAHPEIPWRRIIGQRYVIAHEYGELEDELIWRAATLHVPELIEMLEPLVPPEPEAEG